MFLFSMSISQLLGAIGLSNQSANFRVALNPSNSSTHSVLKTRICFRQYKRISDQFLNGSEHTHIGILSSTWTHTAVIMKYITWMRNCCSHCHRKTSCQCPYGESWQSPQTCMSDKKATSHIWKWWKLSASLRIPALSTGCDFDGEHLIRHRCSTGYSKLGWWYNDWPNREGNDWTTQDGCSAFIHDTIWGHEWISNGSPHHSTLHPRRVERCTMAEECWESPTREARGNSSYETDTTFYCFILVFTKSRLPLII